MCQTKRTSLEQTSHYSLMVVRVGGGGWGVPGCRACMGFRWESWGEVCHMVMIQHGSLTTSGLTQFTQTLSSMWTQFVSRTSTVADAGPNTCCRERRTSIMEVAPNVRFNPQMARRAHEKSTFQALHIFMHALHDSHVLEVQRWKIRFFLSGEIQQPKFSLMSKC